MIARVDQLLAAARMGGALPNAIFAAMPDYAPSFEGAARHTDGTSKDHPVAAGTILRLHPEVAAGVKPETISRILANTAATRGVFIGDRHMHGSGAAPRRRGQRGRSGKFAGLYICPAALADPRIAAHSAAGLAP